MKKQIMQNTLGKSRGAIMSILNPLRQFMVIAVVSLMFQGIATAEPVTIIWEKHPSVLTAETGSGDLSAYAVAGNVKTGQTITYTSATGACGIDENIVYVNDASSGTCTIEAKAEAKDSYDQAVSTLAILTAKVPLPIEINLSKSEIEVGETIETSGTGEAVLTYTVSGPCTATLGQYTPPSLYVTGVDGGTCTINYSYPEDSLYLAWNETRSISVVIPMQEQTIEISELPEFAEKEVDFKVLAIASSGLPVNIAASGKCHLFGDGTVRPGNPGICYLTFSQSGNTEFYPADTETREIIVTGPQTITPSVPPSGQYEAVVTTSATASSGLPVQISVDGELCQFANEEEMDYALETADILLSAIGQCTITYSQPGGVVNGFWFAAAPTIKRKITVARLSQSIVITEPPQQTYQAGGAFDVSAMAIPVDPENPRPVEITVAANSACKVSEGGDDSAVIELDPSGVSCTIYFNQPGDEWYGPAPQLSRTVTLSQVTDGEDIDQFWKARKLFTTGENANTRQPIMSPPMLARNGDVKAPWPNVMVIFGTGKYHEAIDLADKSLQTIYGVHDRGVYDKDLARYKTFANKSALVKRSFVEEEITLSNNQGSQASRKMSDQDAGAIDWSNQFGWYMDLVGNNNEKLGERSVFRPFLANRLFVFNTVQPVSMSCDGATKGWTMLIDWTTGLAPDFPTYDVNMDGSFNDSDKGFIGYFNDTAASELGRGGDSIYDTSGSDARRRQVTFGVGETGTRLGWEEKQPFGVLKRN